MKQDIERRSYYYCYHRLIYNLTAGTSQISLINIKNIVTSKCPIVRKVLNEFNLTN